MKWLLGLSGSPVFLYALAALLASLIAWGGIGWYGKALAERDLAVYQLAAARVITDRLVENQRLSDAAARRGAGISDAYQKGKADAAKAHQNAQGQLARLRATLDAPALGLRHSAEPDPRPVPPGADPTRRPDATACTDHPRAILDAAHRVAQDLETCDTEKRQLASLQQWVRDVCQAR